MKNKWTKLTSLFLGIVICMSLSVTASATDIPMFDLSGQQPIAEFEVDIKEQTVENDNPVFTTETSVIEEKQLDSSMLFEDATEIMISPSDDTSITTRNLGSLFFLNLEQGSKGNAKATIQSIASVLQTDNITLYVYSGTSENSCSTFVTSSSFTLRGWTSKSISFPASRRYFRVSAYINGQYGGDRIKLFNTSGVPYPQYTCPHSGIIVPEPSLYLNKVPNPVAALTTTQRNNYLRYYEQAYSNGQQLNWSRWEVHHIRPRAYGGTHSYSNLVPLPAPIHTTFTSWWAGY